MPQYSNRRRVQHTAGDMFDLVADIGKYPEFVPMCSDMRLRNRRDNEDGSFEVVATMTVAYKMIRQSFTSRARCDKAKLKILVEYLDGPFRHLHNRWVFHPTGEHSCDVEFYIDYEFRSRALALLMGAMFDAAFRRFAVAFEERADTIYGRRQRA